MTKSLKKEQVELLKFEKQLLGLGAGLGALTAGHGAAAQSAVGEISAEQAEKVQHDYLNLVETVQSAHNAIEASAFKAGVTLLRADGAPKQEPPLVEVAKSLLGLG